MNIRAEDIADMLEAYADKEANPLYHGKVGFETFTHCKSIVDKKTFLDLPMRYQPYSKGNNKLANLFLK